MTFSSAKRGSKTFYYGGQAVVEGVMMRGRKTLAMAVRRPNGEIALITKPLSGIYTGRARKVPFLRGIIALIETLVLGIRSLLQSANVFLGKERQFSGAITWGIIIFSLSLAIGLFFIAPLFLARLADPFLSSSLVSNIVEGFIRIAIFLLYLWAINLLPEIKRLFAYHGAEHKAINAYENGALLEVEVARKFSTAHPRCGSTFLLAILVIAIFVFALVGRPELWLRILSRVLLLPVIVAIGYELTQLGAKYAKNSIVRFFFIPGLALQAMTTRQPNDAQLEAAIVALKKVVEADGEEGFRSPTVERSSSGCQYDTPDP